MKAKQLEVIKNKHSQFLSSEETKRPDCETEDIQYALLNGTLPKMRPTAEIISTLKRRLITDRYDRGPKYTDIFQVPKNGKVAEWEKKEEGRMKRINAYRKEVDPVIRKAELHDDSDADEVMETLVASAKKHGLYK